MVGAMRNQNKCSDRACAAEACPRVAEEADKISRHQWVKDVPLSNAREQNVLARQKNASEDIAVDNVVLYMQLFDVRG